MTLFAHGDPITLAVMIIIEVVQKAADNAGPILAVVLKLVGIVLVLPLVVLVLDFLCGLVTAIFVRKKRWLFVVVVAEALVLFVVFCAPAALLLLNDWHAFWAWLTVGVGGATSMIAGLLNSTIIVATVALLSRLIRGTDQAEPDVIRPKADSTDGPKGDDTP